MVKVGRYALVIFGALLGVLFVLWWTRFRKLPTVRVSYTLGKGRAIDLDWIELR
mgnify:CR=1 FL=1